MVSPLSRDNKVVTALADFTPQCDIHPEVLIKLQGRLQTTLDLEELLQIFFDGIQESVRLDGLHYVRPNSSSFIEIGTAARHNVRYNLQTQKEDIGELVFQRSTRFREQELANIEGLLSTLVFPLRNALQYLDAIEASYKDALTGAYNRAFLDQTLEREMEICRRQQGSLALLMLDLDHFKSINDNYGHCVGDTVIKEVVNCINQSIRQTDICFRYGGEEFLVMLNNASIKDVYHISERIRQSINNERFMYEKEPFKVTASIGFTQMQAFDNQESLIERADQALYQAKNNGRNQVLGN